MPKKFLYVSGKKNVKPADNFDWEEYTDNFNGYNLVKNKRVRVKDNDKVYCHEDYAQELYDRFSGNVKATTPKDNIVGTLYNVVDINRLSDHEVILDTDGGMTAVIDMNKEGEFINSLGCKNVATFMLALNEPDYKKTILKYARTAKVESNRVSIMEGFKANMFADFMNQLKEGAQVYGYTAHILSVNNGGYNVDINGMTCFLPGSLAASGPITDFDSMIGKDVNVCVVNYSKQTNNFVVSHKKYLELTLPSRVANELYPGLKVSVKVTGQSKNGLFCAIRDNRGDYPFASLMHRSTMSSDMEKSFDDHEFKTGDEFFAYIHRVDWSDDNKYRIVIGDKAPEKTENENKEE